MADPSKKSDELDPLCLQRTFPVAEPLFSFSPEPLSSALRAALIVLDTNALLVPYNTGKDSFAQIKRTLTALTGQARLVVPGQVAREFARNRSEKLKTLFQQLSRKRDATVSQQQYPLLEGSKEYQRVRELEDQLIAKLGEYREAIRDVLDTVRSWHWDDPVSSLYRELFQGPVVVDPAVDRKTVLEELEYRQTNSIPPGYKDSGKDDRGIGDLLIWRTILEVGRKRKKSVIFVSGDEKSDWWYQSENQALYPRFELVDEYRRETGGLSFHVISFAHLLKQFGASPTVVEEVRQEELVATPALSQRDLRHRQREEALRAAERWLSQRFGLHMRLDPRRGTYILQDNNNLVTAQVLFAEDPERIRFELNRSRRHRELSAEADRHLIVFVAPDETTLAFCLGTISTLSARQPSTQVVAGMVRQGTFVPYYESHLPKPGLEGGGPGPDYDS